MKEEIDQKIEGLKPLIEELLKKDHSYDDLGSANGFHGAEEAKRGFCTYVTNVINRIEIFLSYLNDASIHDYLNHIKAAVDRYNQITSSIDKLVETGVHNPQFPSQREKFITQLKQHGVSIKKQLHSLELELKLCELNKKIVQTDFAEDIKAKAEAEVLRASAAAKNAEKAASEAQRVLEAAQNKTIEKGFEDSASQFGSLYSHHKDYELYWLIALGIASLMVVASVIYALSIDIPENITITTLINLIKRVVLISVPSVFLRLALTKYNAERNLRIIYGHREKVLEQYKSFEAGIGDDTHAKNSFRIEVAKYIFSDPQSNYGNSSSSGGSEININPVVSAVERAAGVK